MNVQNQRYVNEQLNTQQRITLVGAGAEALLKSIDNCSFDEEEHEPDKKLVVDLLSLLLRGRSSSLYRVLMVTGLITGFLF